MSILRVNTELRRLRRGLALAAVISGLGLAVAVHHMEVPNAHLMPDAVMCLAELGAGMALAVAALPLGGVRWRPGDARVIADSMIVPRPGAAARDGPAHLQVFLS